MDAIDKRLKEKQEMLRKIESEQAEKRRQEKERAAREAARKAEAEKKNE